MKKLLIKILWITLFGIAMGFLESAVVIYMREIYYPAGFDFPLVLMSSKLVVTELLREAATLLMLLSIGILTGKSKTEKFAYFIYTFAIWDIFYYVFLKAILCWPESWLTWDVLFLLPTVWTGPVIAPVIVSLTMILLSMYIVFANHKHNDVLLSKREWVLLILGALVIILSFTWDYCTYILNEYSINELFSLQNKNIFAYAIKYVPVSFPWGIFTIGEGIILGAIINMLILANNKYHNRHLSSKQNQNK